MSAVKPKACQLCHRCAWLDRKTGERRPLEICWSHTRKAWTCFRCHCYGAPAQRMRRAA